MFVFGHDRFLSGRMRGKLAKARIVPWKAGFFGGLGRVVVG
jgi:hypothetical protein